jgi:hypothetical protein
MNIFDHVFHENTQKVCSDMEILKNNRGTQIQVNGMLQDQLDDKKLNFIASAPADRRSSFSGSGLPFPSASVAFKITPNQGPVYVNNDNYFSINLLKPNSYYVGMGTYLVPPTIYISYVSNGQKKYISIKIDETIPFRTLTYQNEESKVPRTSPLFYNNKDLPVRTQEQILLSSAYPCWNGSIPENFWGLKPPM